MKFTLILVILFVALSSDSLKAIIKSGSFKYESNQPDNTVTIHQSAELPSSILLPLMPTLPPISKNRPALIELLWDHKE